MIEATQIAQNAQAGYACDYCTKRQPMAFNECKECCKGRSLPRIYGMSCSIGLGSATRRD